MRYRLVAALLLMAGAGTAGAAEPAKTSAGPTRGDEIRALMAKDQIRQAEKAARAWIAELDASGEGSTLEAANRIDLLQEVLEQSHAKPSQALPWAARAAAIHRALDPVSKGCAMSLSSLAAWLQRAGRGEEARPLLEEALSIIERAPDAKRPDIGWMLNGVGAIAGSLGDWSAARRYLERSADVYEESTGFRTPQSRIALFNLGEVLEDIGDYQAAREVDERLLRATGEGSGISPLVRVRALSRIATMDHRLGADDRAREEYDSARTIWEEARSRPEVMTKVGAIEAANTWARLGVAAAAAGDTSASRECFLRAIDVRSGFLGPGSDEVSWDLRRLGAMLEAAGQPAEARPYLERACGKLQANPEIRPSDLADCLEVEASVILEMGDPRIALPIARRAIDAARAVSGHDSRLLVTALDLEARILAALGRVDDARHRAIQAEARARSLFQRFTSWLSEREALSYEADRTSSLDVAITSLFSRPGVEPSGAAVTEVWDELVRSRSMVLGALASRRHVIEATRGQGLDDLVAKLDFARSCLARLFVRGPRPDQADGFAANVRRLGREMEAAERDLAVRSSAYRADLAREQVGWRDVAGSVPPGAALVAYVRYGRTGRRSDASGDVPSYAAFVLAPRGGGPRVVDLGSAERIEPLVARWRELVSAPPSRVLAGDDGKGDLEYAQAASRLRAAIWDPIERSLGDARLVLVVADGDLLQVNLATLTDDDGRFLVESSRAIHEVAAERDLARLSVASYAHGGLLALGGADFGERPPDIADSRSSSPGRSPARKSARPPLFEPLPASLAEVSELGALWKSVPRAGQGNDAVVLVGQEATESAFKRMAGGRRVVHLATHGFSAGAPSPGAGRRGAGLEVELNPLLNTGLAFAGANMSTPSVGAADDGVLLGAEVASLDLSGVEWVVLSACGTGLGAIQDKEGLIGLRTAFQAAGAATMITSLWEVEDRSTLAWMRALYRARLSGLSTADSVRQASRDLLGDARSRKQSTHPYYWGGFIAVGDWR